MPNKVTTAELSTDVVGDVNTKWLTVVGVMAAEAMTMIAATAAAAAAVAAWWYLLGRVQIDATILQHLSIVTITVIARITVHVSVTACVCYDRQAVITCYKHSPKKLYRNTYAGLVFPHQSFLSRRSLGNECGSISVAAQQSTDDNSLLASGLRTQHEIL